MQKIFLSGATGRVGLEIERNVAESDEFELVDKASRDHAFGVAPSGGVVIDFSRPDFCFESLAFARASKLAMVIGTTGLSSDQQAQIRAASADIAICQAANFSIGANLLLSLVEQAAGTLGEGFDAEILDVHHRGKVDAPSGTAKALARAAAGRDDTRVNLDRGRTASARADGEIGIQALRGGDVAGEHSVYFLGDGERLELIHRATRCDFSWPLHILFLDGVYQVAPDGTRLRFQWVREPTSAQLTQLATPSPAGSGD